jgi:HTH-type transcriptional regulator, glycine betaine synthesis regulator
MARSSVAPPPSPSRDSDLPAATAVAELTELEHGVIDIFVRLADILGVPKSVGEIYGLLFASARPLAFQDISDRLEMSKGSASQGLRVLRNVGAIKLVYVASDRRDHFVPETELRALLTGFLKEKVQPHLETGALRIKALRALAASPAGRTPDAQETRLLRSRMDKLNSWHKKGKSIVPLVTRFFG